MNRAQASQDQKHNVQVYGIYRPPFATARMGQHGRDIGDPWRWQITGQYSYFGGLPFSVSANSNNLNAPGSTLYAQLVAPYQTEHGHNRKFGDTTVSGGKPWFNPASFANPAEPSFSLTGSTRTRPTPRRSSPTRIATSSAGLARVS